MARISAVTALRSHPTFLRGVVGATYASVAQHVEAWWVVVSRARYVGGHCLLPCDHVMRPWPTCFLQVWPRFQG